MALAIEPMVMLGGQETVLLDDEWTVITADGSWAAHFEHTVAIMPDGPWVLTAEDGGKSGFAVLAGGTTPQAPPAPGGTHPPRPPLGGTHPPRPPLGGTHPPRPPLGGTHPPRPPLGGDPSP